MAVIAMGKWGGRELNYASDIDALFVYRTPSEPGQTADRARRVAEAFISILGSDDDGAYRVDADLRPEGRRGALVRSLDSYREYWERWAGTWELQSLIKARPVAGDPGLGREFMEAAGASAFPEDLGAEAVNQVRSMKARAEALAARKAPSVEIKRGAGGIRDIEFAVQLLQLVHGRSDTALRVGNTLAALSALGDGGYVRPDDTAALAGAYVWLREVEHRLQLFDLRRTHSIPDDPARRERIAKAMGHRDRSGLTAVAAFDAELTACRAQVRTIHERLFFRPLLETFAGSPAVHLTDEESARRLAALGFLDAASARRAFSDLTGGLSRRSGLMQQMLPLMLDWLSESPDPDLGLNQLRLLVAGATDNAVVVAALRDKPVAAERLCTLLGTSRLLGRLIDRVPAFLSRLGDDNRLESPPTPGSLLAEALGLVEARDDAGARVAALRQFARGHLLWIAASDLISGIGPRPVGRRLSDVCDALAAAALESARRDIAADGVEPPPMAMVALGKWGGREMNYGSDLDALLVHLPGTEPEIRAAHRVAERTVTLLGDFCGDGPGRGVDLGLRPEGRAGAATRSTDSYEEYYRRWAGTWERQALLRARVVAGAKAPGEAFAELATRVAFEPGFGPEETRRVREMKSRIERERIPVGEDPDYHVKLGRGAMADVEWSVQLLQLRHGAGDPGLRLPGTMAALQSLVAGAHLDTGDGTILAHAYELCAAVRNRLFLQAGRPRDSLPSDPGEVTRLARSLGYEGDPRAQLREDYRRATRRSRRVVQRVFYGLPGNQGRDSGS